MVSISACHADDPSSSLGGRVCYLHFFTSFASLSSPSAYEHEVLQEGQTSSIQNFTAGTFAAVAATVVTQPTDVIRTHMQLGNPANARLGILAIVRAIVNNKGPKALLAGAAPRVSSFIFQRGLRHDSGLNKSFFGGVSSNKHWS